MTTMRRCDHPRHDAPVIVEMPGSPGGLPPGWSMFEYERSIQGFPMWLDLCPDCTVAFKAQLMPGELIAVPRTIDAAPLPGRDREGE